MDPPSGFRVKRKPILDSASSEQFNDGDLPPGARVFPERRARSAGPSSRSRLALPGDEENPPPLPPRSRSPHIINDSAATLSPPSYYPPGLRRVGSAATIGAIETHSSTATTTGYPDPPPPYSSALAPRPSLPTTPSFTQTALSTARDLAARLKPLPTTTTKHHTVALHTPPLVLYRGPATSITLTIFTSPSRPLPATRTLRLQRRGLSGDTGARLKALVGSSSWSDVTPSRRANPQDVDPSLERSWTRDIARVTARLARCSGGTAATHAPRETHMIRIPAAAGDGYFRVVVCAGPGAKQPLCSSPVFRVASASADASVLRGASLATLPLEVGVKVASAVANGFVGRAVAPVAGTARAVAAAGGVQRYRPGLDAARVAYDSSGLGERVGAMEGRYAPVGEGAADEELDVVGPDEGPVKPFPLRFQGRVVRGTGNGRGQLGVPTANLGDVPDDIKLRLKGVYFGWACILPRPGLEGISHDWHEAMISAGPSPYASATVLARTTVTVHMIYDFEEQFYDAKMQVIVMGYLRPNKPPHTPLDEALDAVSQDVWLTMASLSRENWGPQMTLDKIKAAKTARTFSDKYVDAREKVQRQVDRIPAHWAGIRTAGAALRDEAHGSGGYWIAR